MAQKHFALILAGGQGTRFWPWSTAAKPKQFLPVIGGTPLLTQTYNRLKRFIAEENIFIIAEKRYWKPTSECLPEFPRARFLFEPAPRNTAPSLVMANIVLSRFEPQACLLAVPADHYIPDEAEFVRQMRSALAQAEENCIVTAGIMPSSPHTGYGYIRYDASSFGEKQGEKFFRVIEFKEKPDRQTAEHYLSQGNYCWNAGMFLYRLDHFKNFLSQYSPYYHEQYLILEKVRGKKFLEAFQALKPDSIDYALMEKVREMRMVKAAFFWNDVGSWSSLLEIGMKDAAGNVTLGDPVLLATGSSLVFAMAEKPVAIMGMKNVAVIDAPGGLLVSTFDELQRIKEIFPKISRKSKN